MSSLGLTTPSLSPVSFTFREERFELRLSGGEERRREGRQFSFLAGQTADLEEQSSDPAQFWAQVERKKVVRNRKKGLRGSYSHKGRYLAFHVQFHHHSLQATRLAN